MGEQRFDSHRMRSITTALRKVDWRVLALAAALTIAQVTFAAASARGNSWRERYFSLWIWDGGWYADILEKGYRTTDPPTTANLASNVAFFPAYPLIARAVWKVSGWSVPASLLFTAQAAAVVFWWFVLRQLKAWRIGSGATLAVIMLIFCHPAAFYMVVTYADSLFMACMAGLLVWGARARDCLPLALGAAVLGYGCSAARIVGAPLAAIPVVWAWNDLWPRLKARAAFASIIVRSWRYALISLATAFGTIGFLIYCAVRFGHWDLYMRTRAAGWAVFKTDYLAMFNPQNFNVSVPGFANDYISPTETSHFYVAILIVLVLAIPALDFTLCWRNKLTGLSERTPFYLAAWLLFFFSASGAGLAQWSYLGFLRYGFYSHVPLLLAVAHAHKQWQPNEDPLPLGAQLVIFLGCALGLALQSQFCYLYAHATMVS